MVQCSHYQRKHTPYVMDGLMHDAAPRQSRLERLSYWITASIALLLPFFFVPVQTVSFQMAKGLLLAVGVVLALVFFIANLIKEGRLDVPRNLITLSLVLIPAAFLASAIATGGSSLAYLGYSFENGTVASVAFMSVLALLVAQLFKSKDRAFSAYLAFLAGFIVVALYQLVRLFAGPDALSFGIFTNAVSNLVGNWNDMAIFFGSTALLSLATLEMVDLKKSFRAAGIALFILSLFFLAVTNFSTLWFALAAIALAFFLYVFSFDKFSRSKDVFAGEYGQAPVAAGKRISWLSLALLVVSVTFAIWGTQLGSMLAGRFDVVSVEVRPSWGTTLDVIGGVLKQSPLFGTGPNGFGEAWLTHKPTSVNETIFWNTDFAAGIGLVPTLIATTGIVGALAILFFLTMLVWMGVRSIFAATEDPFSRYLLTSSFLMAFFFWLMAVLYVPSTVILGLGFFFTGLFMANLYREGIIGSRHLSLENRPKTSFISVLVLVVLLIGTVSLGYLVVRKSVALSSFQQSLSIAATTGNVDEAEAALVRAIALGPTDLYYRGLSELFLVRAEQFLSVLSGQTGAEQQETQRSFQLSLASAIANAQEATVLNPGNYQNWLSLARVYAALVPERVPGAYEEAKRTYERAREENPTSPVIPLLLARLEVANNNLAGAREFANQSLALKSNYAEAHFLISQIEVAEGNVPAATRSLEQTLLLSPQNPGLFFQLGLLRYNQRNWQGAADAFSEAIRLVPEYANARYFRGLTYHELGRKDEALAEFQEILRTNPESQEVTRIIENLEAGRAPLADAAPTDRRPETRSQAPLPQNN